MDTKISSVKIHILRVFVNDEKKFGNPVGIILDEKQEISKELRQHITKRLGFSESIFINNANTGNVSIFNPQSEIDFAGHALVGAAYLMHNVLNKPIHFLECRGGRIAAWQEHDVTWIRAHLKYTPPWIHEQFQNASQVENFSISLSASKKHTIVWAWIEQSKGIVRSRTFAADWGIPEDEANGSGSMQLSAMLGQQLVIHHGKGSVIYAKPVGGGKADVGGRVKVDPSIKYTI